MGRYGEEVVKARWGGSSDIKKLTEVEPDNLEKEKKHCR